MAQPAGTAHWFRWHHGTVSDPKWRVVAKRAAQALSRNVTLGHVIAVWAAMLECASQATPRGELIGWSDEDVGAALDIDEAEVAAIRVAMTDKTLDGDVLISWNARQVRREDVSSVERKKRQRDRERAETSRNVTQEEGVTTDVSRNVTTEERREEEIREELEATTPDGVVVDDAAASVAPPVRSDPIPYREIVDEYNLAMPGLRKARDLTKKRRALIRSAWHESESRRSMAFWRAFFGECQSDSFLNGTGPYREPHANWRPDFDYLLSPKVVTRVFEQAMDRMDRAERGEA